MAPTWPDGATLSISNEQADRLTVQWPAATDDTLVTGYRISVNGIESVTVAGNNSSAIVLPLDSATQYTLSVRAEDAAGNLSVQLKGLGTTADETAPNWATDATLAVGMVTETTAALSWTAATDNVNVTAYRILDGDAVLMEVSAVSATVTDLDAWTHYTLQVRAVDAAGNVSAGGPKAGFQTTDETAPAFDDGAAIQSTNVTPNSLTLTWPQATDNVGISGYEVLRDLVVVAQTSGTIRTATVDSLSPGTEYTFGVRASDPAGNHSTTGPTVTVNTADTVAPNWPDGAQLVASNITANSLLLAWPPATDDVAVALYEVQQDGVGVASVSTTQALIEGLSPWTQYNFSVRAKDAVGNISKGKLTTSLQTLDTSAPGWTDGDALLVSNLTDTSLTLSWPQATDDVSVVAYKVYRDNVPIADLDALTITVDVSGLSPWTDYTFRVAAVDQAGNASTTDLSILQKTADESTPTWPAGLLSVSNATPYALSLTWTLAADDVAVTQYTITQNGAEVATVDGTTTSLSVTELSPWTDYDFKVEAADAAGNWSLNGPSASVKTPDTVKPTWPADATLTVSNLQSTSLELSWPAATDDVGIDHYVITVDGGEAVTVDGELTSATVPNLQPAVTILIGLRAVDPAGNGSSELTTTKTTPDGGPPTWVGDELTATAGMTDVYLSWTTATDDVAVTGYRVFQDGQQIAEQANSELLVAGLGPSTEYTFKVEAGDAAGNWSGDGPSATVTTAKAFDPGFRRLTKEQFERTLADTIGPVWEAGWNTLDGYNDGYAHPNYYRDAEVYYARIMEYSGWWAWHKAYPADNHTAAPGEPRGGFRRLDQVVFDGHAGSWLSAIMKIADAAVEKWVGRMMILRACALDNAAGVTNFATTTEVYENCISNFITDFGMRAFRRPLSAEEHASFMAAYNEVGEKYPEEGLNGEKQAARGLRNVMATIWLSPEFLYRVELGDENGKLTAWELASRLSYHFWNTMPDDELFAAAKDGSLLTEEGYQAQVERLAGDPKAERAIDEFYRDYFRVQELKNPFIQDGPYRYHGGPEYSKYGNATGNPVPSMQNELANLGMWFTATNPGTYEDMFRTNLHFLECNPPSWAPDQCYGAGPWSQWSYGIPGCEGKDADGNNSCTGGGWDGVSDPITFPESERAGLLTRLAFLAHDTHIARPIRRGLKIREMLLCDPIPPPENCDVVKPPVLTGLCDDPTKAPDDQTNLIAPCSDDQHCAAGETCKDWDKELTMTVREVVEELTETPGTSCAGCHSTFINGFGHALGHFSSRGQYWDKERLFKTQKKADGSFNYYNLLPEEEWAPIDTEGTAILNGQSVTVDGAHDLADTLVDSGQLEWCWSREYFRFAMGRIEWDVDEDTIENFAQTLRDGATLGDAFKAIAYLPQFKTLYKPPKAQPTGDTP
jgi:chitodextrinase